MGCEQWREGLSAQLDGKATSAEQDDADAHLGGCAGCRRWFEQAAAVTRRSRLTLSAPAGDLTDSILAVLPSPAPSLTRFRERLALTLRAVLGLVGALQLVLGLAQIGRGPSGGHDHASAIGSGHLWHESAAWNVAIGAGFLFVAVRRTPTTGLLPTLSAFVGTLVLLSVNDLLTGRVDPTRLISHGFLLTGYTIVVALSRSRLRPDGPPARGGSDRPGWRLDVDDAPQPTAPTLRLIPLHLGSARAADRWAA
ncbi:zf-HC2 domain-containing protein [Micromonospora sp. NPDC005087]|uniref:zf-HC2 domain-containing protein n=1 Tax=Micromonospora sp. NPDC005087 TaxID=3364225 RepID=UPI0036BDF90F